MLLLGGKEVAACGDQRVGPPVPGGNKQENGNEDCVRRKEERDLAVRESQQPGDSCRQVITNSSGEDPGQGPEGKPGAFVFPGATAEFQVDCPLHCVHHSSHAIASRLRIKG